MPASRPSSMPRDDRSRSVVRPTGRCGYAVLLLMRAIPHRTGKRKFVNLPPRRNPRRVVNHLLRPKLRMVELFLCLSKANACLTQAAFRGWLFIAHAGIRFEHLAYARYFRADVGRELFRRTTHGLCSAA